MDPKDPYHSMSEPGTIATGLVVHDSNLGVNLNSLEKVARMYQASGNPDAPAVSCNVKVDCGAIP